MTYTCYLGKPSQPPMVKDLTKKKGKKKKRIWLYKLQFSKVIEQIEWRFLQSVKSLEILDYVGHR